MCIPTTGILWKLISLGLMKFSSFIQAVGGHLPRYFSTPASWRYLRIYSPGGTYSGILVMYAISNKLTFDLDTVSESHATWATCAKFSLPRPLCSRVRPDVRDRQTDDRQQHHLMPLPCAQPTNHTTIFAIHIYWLHQSAIGVHRVYTR